MKKEEKKQLSPQEVRKAVFDALDKVEPEKIPVMKNEILANLLFHKMFGFISEETEKAVLFVVENYPNGRDAQ